MPQATAWQAIESGEPAKFVANLRAIGCPEQTIRDIVVTRVSREFHGRLMSAYADDSRRQPWWRGRSPSRESVDLSQLRLSLRGQRDDLLEEHFGESAYRLTFQILGRPGGIAAGRVYLPADKRRALRELDSLYARLSAELTFPIGEAVGDDEQAALKDLRRRKRADLEALLSPQESEELDLRESAAARYVLRKLPQALSEADFRLMVRAAREGGIADDTEAASVALARRYGLGPRNESGQSGQQDQQAFIEPASANWWVSARV